MVQFCQWVQSLVWLLMEKNFFSFLFFFFFFFCLLGQRLLRYQQILLLATEQGQAHDMMSYTSQKDKTLNDDAGRVLALWN